MHRSAHAWALSFLLALGAIAAGCSLGNVTHDACKSSAECVAAFGAGSTCSEGYCSDAMKCTSDAECTNGVCKDGFCAPIECNSQLNGVPCYQCKPSKPLEFENACTSAQCTPFDRTRLTKIGADGKLPPLP
jgi:hypothetical protein